MYYNHNLRTKLQEWRNRLYKAPYSLIDKQFNFFIDSLEQEALIKSIIVEASDRFQITEDSIQEWHKALHRGYKDKKVFKSNEEYAVTLFGLLKRIKENGGIITAVHNLVGGKDFPSSQNQFIDTFVNPLVNYLHDVLDESNSTLYLLEKYKKRTEWFMKEQLLVKYKNAASGQNEKVLEDDLRLYLFDQGIDYPFSTPSSASGRADLIGLIDTKNPLILEIKIYDTEKGYGKNRVISGFAQAVQYSNDYHKDVGYLVVYNADPIEITIETSTPSNLWPAKVHFNNKVYYIIFVNLNYEVSASKLGKLKKVSIKEGELIKDIHD